VPPTALSAYVVAPLDGATGCPLRPELEAGIAGASADPDANASSAARDLLAQWEFEGDLADAALGSGTETGVASGSLEFDAGMCGTAVTFRSAVTLVRIIPPVVVSSSASYVPVVPESAAVTFAAVNSPVASRFTVPSVALTNVASRLPPASIVIAPLLATTSLAVVAPPVVIVMSPLTESTSDSVTPPLSVMTMSPAVVTAA